MKIRLIATGGTIASAPGEDGLAPALGSKDLLSCIPLPDGAEVDCLDLYSMDSSNIQPEEWLGIAEAVDQSVRAGFRAVVITHGTDTMAYTASMLTFLLQNVPIPVILTGSQYPILRPDSDGRDNLYNALLAAMALKSGVVICFSGALIQGCRAVKTRTTSLNAFESINYPYRGSVVGGRFYELFTPPETGAYRYYNALEPHVALVKLIPGTIPALLESAVNCGMKGLVVEAFGLGGVHSFRRDHAESIRRIIHSGVPVVLSTQCLYEASTPDIYAVSRPLVEAGVIPAHDMTREAAVTKLMWALKQTSDADSVSKLMRTDLCGEISAAGK